MMLFSVLFLTYCLPPGSTRTATAFPYTTLFRTSWGYGGACPGTAGTVILDLSRMNRIREVDPALAYAVIEPGVTQGQLSEHLRAQGIALWPDCTGAGPDTSIVGNILDRGFGHTPYGNRAQYISGLEIVLADGRVLRTG